MIPVITVIKYNANQGSVEIIQVTNSYKYMIDELESNIFDISPYKIGKHTFDIMQNHKNYEGTSAINSEGDRVISGNMLIFNHDDNGNIISLSDTDIKYLLGMFKMHNVGDNKYKVVLTECSYEFTKSDLYAAIKILKK